MANIFGLIILALLPDRNKQEGELGVMGNMLIVFGLVSVISLGWFWRLKSSSFKIEKPAWKIKIEDEIKNIVTREKDYLLQPNANKELKLGAIRFLAQIRYSPDRTAQQMAKSALEEAVQYYNGKNNLSLDDQEISSLLKQASTQRIPQIQLRSNPSEMAAEKARCEGIWEGGWSFETMDTESGCQNLCRQRSILQPGKRLNCSWNGKMLPPAAISFDSHALCFAVRGDDREGVLLGEVTRSTCEQKCLDPGKPLDKKICSWDHRDVIINKSGYPVGGCATWNSNKSQKNKELHGDREFPIIESICSSFCKKNQGMDFPGSICTWDGKIIGETGFAKDVCFFRFGQASYKSFWQDPDGFVDKSECQDWCESERSRYSEAWTKCFFGTSLQGEKLLLETREPKIPATLFGACEITVKQYGYEPLHLSYSLTQAMCTDSCRQTRIVNGARSKIDCSWRGVNFLNNSRD